MYLFCLPTSSLHDKSLLCLKRIVLHKTLPHNCYFSNFLEWAIAIRCNQNIYFIEFCFLHFSYTSLNNLTFRRSYDEIYYLNQERKSSILFLTYKASYYELPPLVWVSLNTLYDMSRRHSSATRSSLEHRDVTEVSRRNHFLQVDIHHVSPHITSSLLHGPLEAKSQLDTVHPRYKVSSKLFRKIVKKKCRTSIWRLSPASRRDYVGLSKSFTEKCVDLLSEPCRALSGVNQVSKYQVFQGGFILKFLLNVIFEFFSLR